MYSIEQIGHLSRLPRAILCDLVTPLQTMPNLANHLGAGELLIKRDDLTPLAMGGNKVRQLEFYLGDAVDNQADTIIITGAVQSNFVRLAAASASKLGMHCHIQLEERVSKTDADYHNSGNVLLDRLLGATLHYYPHGEDEAGADANMETIAAALRQQGQKPYVIHLGPGHPSLGALGYVVAAVELANQFQQRELQIDALVVPSGSGATHAGVIFGLRAIGVDIGVVGSCVRRNADVQVERIHNHCASMASLVGMENPVADNDIVLVDEFLAPGYGKPGAAAREAIRLAGNKEGLIVDPVYSSKSLACFIELARQNPSRRYCFWHTGGAPAVFAYQSEMLSAIESTNSVL